MPDWSLEDSHGGSQGKIICGVDEVGRGPLAGPVIAAAVILPRNLPEHVTKNIRDSKKMSATQRATTYALLVGQCRFAVAEASVDEIDSINILWASMLAMERAVKGLEMTVDIALIDGNHTPRNLSCHAVTAVMGDDRSLSIAAASIIAKVTRDRLMKKLAAQHPGYGWERNAGYGTREHLDALKRLGITDWHRDSFAPVSELIRLKQ